MKPPIELQEFALEIAEKKDILSAGVYKSKNKKYRIIIMDEYMGTKFGRIKKDNGNIEIHIDICRDMAKDYMLYLVCMLWATKKIFDKKKKENSEEYDSILVDSDLIALNTCKERGLCLKDILVTFLKMCVNAPTDTNKERAIRMEAFCNENKVAETPVNSQN